MNEILQLIGSVVTDGFVVIIGIWIAWLAGAFLVRKANGHIQSRGKREFDQRPFDERPFDGDNDVANDGG